jgi:hypothetical protein
MQNELPKTVAPPTCGPISLDARRRNPRRTNQLNTACPGVISRSAHVGEGIQSIPRTTILAQDLPQKKTAQIFAPFRLFSFPQEHRV